MKILFHFIFGRQIVFSQFMPLTNKKIYDRVEILKPTINELKRLTIKIISNIGPLN